MEGLLAKVAGALPEPLVKALESVLDSVPPPAKEFVDTLPEPAKNLLTTPEGLFVVLLSLLLGFLLLLVVFSGGKGSKKGRTIVVAGPSNAGKTTLFFQLKDGSLHNGVVASMDENVTICSVGTKAVRLLDIPGHPSMRDRLDASLSEASGVVFLVDAVEVTPHRAEAAELLYDILVSPVVQKQRLPVLVACNKMDLELDAHSVDFIRRTLEKQIDTMRKTKTAGIGKEAGVKRPALGPADKPFSFQGLKSKVDLAEVSAKQGRLEEVQAFMARCI